MSKIKDYVISRLNEIDQEDMSEEVIGDIAEDTGKTFGVKCDYFYAGDFDSPGYDCYYYVIVFVNENGDLEGVDCQVESY